MLEIEVSAEKFVKISLSFTVTNLQKVLKMKKWKKFIKE